MDAKTNKRRRAPAVQPEEESRRMWAAVAMLGLVVGCLVLAAMLQAEPRPQAESLVERPAAVDDSAATPPMPTGGVPPLAERARRDEARLGTSSGDWTLQLMMACDADTLRTAVDSAGGAEDLFLVAAADQGDGCYRILWGRYSDRQGASRAGDVPAGLLAPGEQGWPRPIAQVLAP
jgi:hypothetical protein